MNVRLRRLTAGVGLVWLLGAGPARADGAFPDASRILLPAGEPDTITLATNFGLIATTDGGATWTWSCETLLLTGGRGFQLAADESGAPGRILALSAWGLVHSDDAGCGWTPSEGDGKENTFSDVFVSAAAPATAWALGIEPQQALGLAQVLFTSSDGAATLSGPLFRAVGEQQLLGVESALADPSTIYLTLAAGQDFPSLAVSRDGGAHWETRPLERAVGSGLLRILSVDIRSKDTVYLRQSTVKGDRLLVTRDAGATWEVGLTTSGSLSAFLQRGDGTLLVGVLEADGRGSGYRSSDGGRTFLPWHGVPHLRALAERDGLVFAAADDVQDGFALGVSQDGGATFLPRLRYAQVSAVAPCVRSECRATCERLADIGLWPARLCLEPAAAPDGGAVDAAAGDGSSGPPPRSRGGCSVTGARSGSAPAATLALVVAVSSLLASRCRRRQRRQ